MKPLPAPFSITPAVAALLGALLLLGWPRSSTAQEVPGGCGQLYSQGRFGPYDYRAGRYIPESVFRSHSALLSMVENAHFTPEVEILVRGKTSTRPGYDISYTLHAFPNHHRALIAVDGLGEKEKTDKPVGSSYTVECWFRRAVAWRADDQIVRMIYAKFLAKAKRDKEAEEQLLAAANLAGDNAFTHLNIGLIYFDMKRFDEALSYAHKAEALGLTIPTLRDQLKKAGKWTDPVAAVEQATSQPAKD